MRKFYFSIRVAAFAAPLFFVMSAQASIVQISTPNSTYTSSTTLIPITGNDFDTFSSISDSTETVTFSTTMEKFSVPSTWSSWSSPPASETATPNVLSPEDYTVTSVTLSFSTPVTTFGLEAEPDAIAQYGAFPVTLTFFNGATQLGVISNSLLGTTDSALFAGTIGASTLPITSVVIAVGGNTDVPGGTDPGIAQIRYTAATPEPATLFTCGGALALLVGLRRRASRSR